MTKVATKMPKGVKSCQSFEAQKLEELAKCAHEVKLCGTHIQKLHGTIDYHGLIIK